MKSRHKYKLQIGGRKVILGSRTLILGVVNVTPDSFSDGGLYLEPARAIERGVELVREGADWIDVGGESTRPGSRPTAAEEELRRILPVIRGLRKRLPGVPTAIDTTKAEVAEQALRAGAAIINDVSGLRFDPRLAGVARRFHAPLILMHLRGRPETMQQKPFARDIWRSLRKGLTTSIRRALAAGVRRSQLIIDPGLGFGKTRRQNFEILAQLDRLRVFRLPIVVGTSRKSFVQAVVAGEGLEARSLAKSPGVHWPVTGVGEHLHGAPPSRSRREGHEGPPLPFGDAAAVAASIVAGAHIVRVHDVAAILPAARIADAILEAERSDKPK